MAIGRITVREAAPHELPELGRITEAAYRSVLGGTLSDGYAAQLRDTADRARNAVLLVAAGADGELLGTVTYVPGLGPYAEFDDPRDAGIRMLAVDPAAQGRGAGEVLVRECMRRAREEGRGRIVLHSTEAMTAAHRLYERLGFRRAPEIDWTVEAAGILLVGFILDDASRPAP